MAFGPFRLMRPWLKNNRRLILHKKMSHIELWLELEHVFVVKPPLHSGANITLFADGLPVLWLRFLQATQICIFLGDQTRKFSVLPSAKYNLPNIVIIVCTIDLYIFPLPESVKSVQFPCNFQCWFRQLLMFTVREIRTNLHSRTYKFGMFMFPWPSNAPLYLADFGMLYTYCCDELHFVEWERLVEWMLTHMIHLVVFLYKFLQIINWRMSMQSCEWIAFGKL